ncbi:hypothetical protein BY458DRAFT_512260 [Sporodiniella umbellata]|nr:hypothetical protein BY458DRAFT_512260 [Sporodiniella umbellata]
MPFAKANEIDNKLFDFVIIGGGTAGCVLANRLSFNGEYSILVLEAGTLTHREVLESRVPLLNSRLKNTEVDWKHQSARQPNANQRSISIPSGKMLGGCSSFNACLFHRCSPSDFDSWNVKGWHYNDLKSYFCKAESFHDEKANANIHGMKGPVHATQQQLGLLGNHFKHACKEMGIPEHYDLTDKPCQIGITTVQASIYEGERSSTSASYLPNEVICKSNLTLAMGCKVEKITFEQNVAQKVEFKDFEGSIFTVNIGRELILCAGALLSPFLLLKSGVGPKDELSKHGIPMVVNLPGVGKNLQNHWRIPLVHETLDSSMSMHNSLFVDTEETLRQALDNKTGPFTRVWPDAVAYLKIPNTPDNSSHLQNAPQMELFTGGLALCKSVTSLKNVPSATLLMVLLAPFSRGSVTLTGTQDIQIDLGLLKDERDMECFEKGLRFSIDIANNSEYKNNCIKRWILPSESFDSIDLKRYIREQVETIHHYAGTCKMGPKEEPTAVVDEHLKVHNVHNVRVVDASFFPTVPAGQICFPVIACAEKAADIILEYNNTLK